MEALNYPEPPPKLVHKDAALPLVGRINSRHNALRDALERDLTPETATAANVLEPLIHDANQADMEFEMLSISMYASPEKAERDAAEAAIQQLRTQYSQDMSRKKLFTLLQAVKDKGEEMEPEYARYLDKLLDQYRQAGHGVLSDEQIKEYAETSQRISNLCHEFTRNISEDEGGIWVAKAELNGVSASDLERFKVRGGEEEAKEEYFIPCNAEHRIILKTALNPATRKKVWVANAQNLEKNAVHFRDIAIQRDTLARQLGFSSHADKRMPDRVAKDTGWVESLLSKLKETLMPLGRADMDRLLKRKSAELAANNATGYADEHADIMPPWDYMFYSRLAEQEIGVDHEAMAEYFPLRHTVAAMMGLFSRFLQLRFEKLTDEQVEGTTWHEDVEAWGAWDVRGEGKPRFVGYVFLDLLFRPGKYRGGQDDNMRPSYVKSDGGRVYPSTCLMCCFPRPTGSSCALLKHQEVVTVFHELGHGIHDIVSRTKTAKFHGWRSPPEFNETPSMMLENWCWMKDVLREMGCHYTSLSDEYAAEWRAKNPGRELPAKQIPEAQLDALVASRGHNLALWQLYQLSIATFDMKVYNPPSHEALVNLDMTQLSNDIDEECRMLTRPGKGFFSYGYAHTRHLILGMDAGYYAYLAAQVFASNIFKHTFEKDPFDPVAWDRYRTGILEYGGSKDELDLVTDYLGHEPTVDVFFDHVRSMSRKHA